MSGYQYIQPFSDVCGVFNISEVSYTATHILVLNKIRVSSILN